MNHITGQKLADAPTYYLFSNLALKKTSHCKLKMYLGMFFPIETFQLVLEELPPGKSCLLCFCINNVSKVFCQPLMWKISFSLGWFFPLLFLWSQCKFVLNSIPICVLSGTKHKRLFILIQQPHQVWSKHKILDHALVRKLSESRCGCRVSTVVRFRKHMFSHAYCFDYW